MMPQLQKDRRGALTSISPERDLLTLTKAMKKKRKISLVVESPFVDLTESDSGTEEVEFLGTSITNPIVPPSVNRDGCTKSINDVLRDQRNGLPVVKSLPPLFLTTPEQVAKYTPCTLHLNFLPQELAERLYRAMLGASSKWQRNKWFLNDRQVESPHTTCFYSSDEKQNTSHWYMGRKAEGTDEAPMLFPQEMLDARTLIESSVNAELDKRNRFALEYSGPWQANVAAANCYRGASEVGIELLIYISLLLTLLADCGRTCGPADLPWSIPEYSISVAWSASQLPITSCAIATVK